MESHKQGIRGAAREPAHWAQLASKPSYALVSRSPQFPRSSRVLQACLSLSCLCTRRYSVGHRPPPDRVAANQTKKRQMTPRTPSWAKGKKSESQKLILVFPGTRGKTAPRPLLIRTRPLPPSPQTKTPRYYQISPIPTPTPGRNASAEAPEKKNSSLQSPARVPEVASHRQRKSKCPQWVPTQAPLTAQELSPVQPSRTNIARRPGAGARSEMEANKL